MYLKGLTDRCKIITAYTIKYLTNRYLIISDYIVILKTAYHYKKIDISKFEFINKNISIKNKKDVVIISSYLLSMFKNHKAFAKFKTIYTPNPITGLSARTYVTLCRPVYVQSPYKTCLLKYVPVGTLKHEKWRNLHIACYKTGINIHLSPIN